MVEYIEREAVLSKAQTGWVLLGLEDDAVSVDDIEAIPAADVAPVVHGRWIDEEGNTVGMVDGVPYSECWCSVCGDFLTGSDESPAKGYHCPNCGAKMDGGDGNG